MAVGNVSADSWAANPRSVDAAIAYAEGQVRSKNPVWYRRCLAFCAAAYGLPGSGTNYAIDIWSQVPTPMRHSGASGIPRGALLLYRTGSRAGHIALYGGNGVVYSNDIGGNGKIAKVKFENLVSGPWRLNYVGWVPPYFPRSPLSKVAGSISQQPLSNPDGTTATNPDPGTAPIGGAGDNGTLSAISAAINWAADAQHWINLFLIFAGVLCIVFALYRIAGEDILKVAKEIS
jgi:hypothetical protein